MLRRFFSFGSLPRNLSSMNKHSASSKCADKLARYSSHSFSLKQPCLDLEYLTNESNWPEIEKNIKERKGVGCIRTFGEVFRRYGEAHSDSDRAALWSQVLKEGLKIPNKSDPRIFSYRGTPRMVESRGKKPDSKFPLKEFHTLAHELGILRTENLGNLTGPRSYYFIKELAVLEQALIEYTVETLLNRGFTLYSVPDLLHPQLIESCGFDTQSDRTQVYRLDPELYGQVCLSGTAEMSLAAYNSDKVLPASELPLRMAAVSRCYRAETSNVQEERGIYRVHQFTKVEMFAITSQDVICSNNLLDEFVQIEKDLYDSLQLHYQVLDMPPHELGAPAYRKFDIEAWMPGRCMYGEISSASNCIDYQARRLAIRYIDSNGQERYVHTVNGTACAVPRMLIALLETNQLADGNVVIPDVLRPYCGGLELIERKDPLKLQWIKFKSQQGKISK